MPNANILPFHIPDDANIDIDNPSRIWRNCVKDINKISYSMSDCSAVMFVDPSMRILDELITLSDFSFPKSNLSGGIAAYHPFSYGSIFYEDKLCDSATGFLINGGWGIDTLVNKGVKPVWPVIEVHSV